jgi:hypothetical protein
MPPGGTIGRHNGIHRLVSAVRYRRRVGLLYVIAIDASANRVGAGSCAALGVQAAARVEDINHSAILDGPRHIKVRSLAVPQQRSGMAMRLL